VSCAPESIASYSWGDRLIDFYHCTTCGCLTHYENADKSGDYRFVINARMMAPEDIAGVPVRRLDGADTWEYLDP